MMAIGGKLGDRPRAGEEHPSPLPADRRLERNTLEASLSGRLQTNRLLLAICGPADLLPPSEGSIPTLSPDWGDSERPQ